MKKIIATLGLIGFLALGSTAMATTWTDTVTSNFEFASSGSSLAITYNLTGVGGINVLTDPSNPFVPSSTGNPHDSLSSATLDLFFSDFSGSSGHASYSLDAGTPTTFTVILDKNINVLATAFATLNSNGTLDLTLSRTNSGNDFTLDRSVLTATGTDNTQTAAPVPEPGTMMLLGAGFLGLAVYGKRRKNA